MRWCKDGCWMGNTMCCLGPCIVGLAFGCASGQECEQHHRSSKARASLTATASSTTWTTKTTHWASTQALSKWALI